MPAEIKKPLGILAGEGVLPIMLAQYCLDENIPVCAVRFKGCDYQEKWPVSLNTLDTRIEKVGDIFSFFKKNNVTNVVLIGNLARPSIGSLRPDWRGLKTLGRVASSLINGGDDNLLRTLRKEIEGEGFHVCGISHYLPHLTLAAKSYTIVKPNEHENVLIKQGIAQSQNHGKVDKGQSILIHSDGFISYEDHEGTRALIRNHGRPGSILVKTTKPQQDPDLDRPTVGLNTLETLCEMNCAGLAIQANSVYAVQQQDMINYADRHSLFIEAVNV